jgi:N-acetylmuramoyl-L-alanine amidase
MRACVLILLATFVSACAPRSIPPEISVLHEKKPAAPRKLETIVIDAGHGGKDSGSISQRDSYEEKVLTLETAQMIRTCLNQLGYKTVMTRNQDIFVPLSTRAEIANSLDADLFVSIHYNYSPNGEAKGVEVYYFKEDNNPPSSRIAQSKYLGSLVLKKVISQTGADSRGLKEANFAVIRETRMPAILVEAGFLSNPSERERVRDPKYQRLIARGIAQGIDQYLEAVHTIDSVKNRTVRP